ncbi:MAG: MoaD/ThiS family protein [Planctomycetota bacterium]|jgi:molybdopterin converting factor small subunit
MVAVTFASAIQRHHPCPKMNVTGKTLREALEEVFASQPPLRSYILDDQGKLRTHVAIFIDGEQVQDQERQSDPIAESAQIHVIQALSGG